MSKIIHAADYASREALDAFLLTIPSAEKDTSFIEGTVQEMQAKRLSNTTRVHGVPCRITDAPKVAGAAAPVDRGPIKKFGLGGQKLKDKTAAKRTRAARRPAKTSAMRAMPKKSIKRSRNKNK